MGEFTTALGESFAVERRLPSLGWRPRMRRSDNDGEGALDFFSDVDLDDLGVLAIVGLFLLAIALIVLLAPLLLFVAEVALVVAIVIPLTLLGLAVGVVRHTVLLRAGGRDGAIVDQREVRGPIASYRAKRALRAAAESGAYRLVKPQAAPAVPRGSTPPPGLGG